MPAGSAGPTRAEAEVEGDSDAVALATVLAHGVREPGREQDDLPAPGRDQLARSRRLAARDGEAEERRIHRRRHAARVLHLELAAERGVLADAAVVDVVGPRPVAAGMGVKLVAMAAAVDVGPGGGLPGDAHGAAGAIGGEAR